MFKITIVGARDDSGKEPTVDTLVPAVPRVGEYVSHDRSGITGTVKSVQYWWPEDGGDLVIEVRAR